MLSQATLLQNLKPGTRAQIAALVPHRHGAAPINRSKFLVLSHAARADIRVVSQALFAAAEPKRLEELGKTGAPLLTDLDQDAWNVVAEDRLRRGACIFDAGLSDADVDALEQEIPGLYGALVESRMPAGGPPAASPEDDSAMRQALRASVPQRTLLLSDLDPATRLQVVENRRGGDRGGAEDLLRDTLDASDIGSLDMGRQERIGKMQRLARYMPAVLFEPLPEQGSSYTAAQRMQARALWFDALLRLEQLPVDASNRGDVEDPLRSSCIETLFAQSSVQRAQLDFGPANGGGHAEDGITRDEGDCLFHALAGRRLDGNEILAVRDAIAKVRESGDLRRAQGAGGYDAGANRRVLLESLGAAQADGASALEQNLLQPGKMVPDEVFAAFQRCPHVWEGEDTVAQWTLCHPGKSVLMLTTGQAVLMHGGKSSPFAAECEVNAHYVESFIREGGIVLYNGGGHWQRVEKVRPEPNLGNRA